MSGVLLEGRSFRPFKSSEEYLYAMKEDLAEWFQTLYPHLRIGVENFMDRLETGVALCEHANAVKAQAAEYVGKKQARMAMTRSVTGSLAQAQALVRIADVKFFPTAKPSTFFARDNVSNFIHWCRTSLEIIECLLFESDDLIMRKNEKHVILCLLEVARRGAKFGMLAPMLVQMERQIDREIAADQRKLGFSGETHDGDSDSELEDEQPVLMYGPCPQIVTNDLKSLDEMVRDLVEKCTCPTQFPMIRVSEGKYRIGDTKVLIFVRILRNHVMVRVGGGWDTLAHYLDKHDPCRCRSQHRTTQGARLVNKPGAPDLVGAQVYYDRSPPRIPPGSAPSHHLPHKDYLGPPMNSLNRSRSRSPGSQNRRSVSPNLPRKSLVPPPNRSRSPTPNYISTATAKLKKPNNGPQSLPYIPPSPKKAEAKSKSDDNSTDHSDNASEVSDEGYRSLGIVHEKGKNRASVYSQNSFEDVDENDRQEPLEDDETNSCGLRRTHFSQRIYESEPKPPTLQRSHSAEKTSPDRSSSSERKQRSVPSKKPPNHNTWNGRQRSARPSLNDVFSSPFQRSSPLRQSASSIWDGRRSSSSASTSPTKGRLRQELLKTVRSHDNELEIVQKVQALLREYDGLGEEIGGPRSLEERGFYSRRKDSRPDNLMTRIPAPVKHLA